ncbi:MAG: response regulator [Sterolibacterium sp.]
MTKQAQFVETLVLKEILLVDDAPASLQLLTRLLEEAGYVVRQAPSGKLALWTIESKHPDLILLDVKMPGTDGFEVCRLLKANPATRDIPVIFLSAQDEVTDRVRGFKLGAVDFIAKDFAKEEILARVDTHLTLAYVKKALETERETLEARVKERTREIEQSKVLLQRVVDSFPDWIFVKDIDHRFLLVNKAMADANDLKQQDMVGKQDIELFSPELAQVFHEEDEKILAGNIYRGGVRHLRLSDTQERIFEIFKGPMHDNDGRIFSILGNLRDITDRVATEKVNRELREKISSSRRIEALGQLTAGIAHDFNNILAVILGFAEFARKAVAAGKHEKLGYYLSEILQSSQRGKELVQQLLTFARNREASDTAIEVTPIVREINRLLQGTSAEDKIITFYIDEALPPVRIQAVHLHQVLMNLVTNAHDASPSDGRIEFRVVEEHIAHAIECSSCHREFGGRFVRFSVKDNGIGIQPSAISAIFEPFFTTKEIGKGSGLGLSVIHGIVHSARGHVHVSSSPGIGTQFDVYLPSAPTDMAPEGTPSFFARLHQQVKGHLLVIDDEPSILAFETELLESIGCQVVATSDTAVAISLLEKDPLPFDLVVLDQSMSNMTMLEKAMNRHPALPIVICSGYVKYIGSNAAIQRNIRFLQKPVSGELLANTVEEMLQQKSHSDEPI